MSGFDSERPRYPVPKPLEFEDFEQTILSELFVSPDRFESLNIEPKHFLSGKCRLLFQIICDLYSAHGAYDLVTVALEYQKRMGAASPVFEIFTSAFYHSKHSMLLFPEKIKILLENYKAYKLWVIYQEHADRPDVLIRMVEELNQETIVTENDDTFESILVAASKEHKNTISENILSYGYSRLDDNLGGIFPGELVLVGGTTGTGKTTFTLSVARKVAEKCKVFVLALEERISDYALKLIYFEIGRIRALERKANYPWNKFRRNEIDSPFVEVEKTEAIRRLKNNNINFYKNTGKILTPDSLEKIIRKQVMKGVKFFVIDHLHMLAFGDKVQKEQQLEALMQRLNVLKDALNISIMLVAHFKKIDEKKRPTMSDFKDAMAIPQAANTILLLFRQREDDDNVAVKYTEFICPKSRGAMNEFITSAKFDKAIGDYVFIN